MAFTTTGEIISVSPTSITVRFTDGEGRSQEKLFSCRDTFSYNVGGAVSVTKSFGTWDLADAYDVDQETLRRFRDRG